MAPLAAGHLRTVSCGARRSPPRISAGKRSSWPRPAAPPAAPARAELWLPAVWHVAAEAGAGLAAAGAALGFPSGWRLGTATAGFGPAASGGPGWARFPAPLGWPPHPQQSLAQH